MKAKIKSLEDLQGEIIRLSLQKHEQEKFLENQFFLLKNKIEAPVRIFNSITSSIPGVGFATDLVKNAFSKNPDISSGDLFTRIARIGVPLLLNRTVLRNSGWLKKALLLLVSETAAGQVTKDTVSGALNKFAKFIRPKKKKYKKPIITELDVFEDAPEDHILGI